jgi:hypothetical protein
MYGFGNERQQAGPAGRTGCAEVVVTGPPVAGGLHQLTESRGVDHLGSVADVEAHGVDPVGRSVEDQVARLQWCSGRQPWPGVVLGLGGPWGEDTGSDGGRVCQARAVEAGVAAARPRYSDHDADP